MDNFTGDKCDIRIKRASEILYWYSLHNYFLSNSAWSRFPWKVKASYGQREALYVPRVLACNIQSQKYINNLSYTDLT